MNETDDTYKVVDGLCDQLKALNKKLTRLDDRFVGMDKKITSIGRDLSSMIKDSVKAA